MSFFPLALNGLQVTHSSPQDFSVAFTSNVTVTASGSSFSIDDTNCTVAYVYYKPTGGTWQEPLINGLNGVSIVASSGVLTVAGAGTPFASGDQYLVGLIYQDKSFAAPLDATQQARLNPESQNFTPGSLVDTTNLSAATHDYELVMNGFNYLALSGKFIDADGTITMKVYAMNDEDTTSGDWIQVYGYNDDLNTTTNNWSVTNGTLTYAISFNKCNYTNVKVEIVCSGATNTVIAKERRMYS